MIPEFKALQTVPDNFPKTVLSMDAVKVADREGIRWQNLIEFLMA